ncbi:MAG: hypothetical protein ABSH03_14295 [Candidatus Lustribacter sp.]
MMLLTLAVAAAPAAAPAQPAPSGAPSYAVPGPAGGQETIHGQVASFDPNSGDLQLNDDRGFVDNVQLGQGTVVRPGDAQLQPGMVVTIVGVANGPVFAADSVDVGGPAVAGPVPPPAPGADGGHRRVVGLEESPRTTARRGDPGRQCGDRAADRPAASVG